MCENRRTLSDSDKTLSSGTNLREDKNVGTYRPTRKWFTFPHKLNRRPTTFPTPPLLLTESCLNVRICSRGGPRLELFLQISSWYHLKPGVPMTEGKERDGYIS